MSAVPPPLGALFLDELRRLGQPLGPDYATVQRIKGMGREELLAEVRKVAGQTYAGVQLLKTIESPVELAREIARKRTAQGQAMFFAILVAMG